MFSKLYDCGYLFKCLLWLVIVFYFMRLTNGFGFAIVIPIVLYCALAQRTEALLFWLLVAVCSVIINPTLIPKGSGYAWMQRGLMLFLGFVMAVNVMKYSIHRSIRPYAGMFCYIAFMLIPSALGWNPTISYLKLILFSLVYFAYLAVANQANMNPHVSTAKIRSVMLSVSILFIFGSVVLVPFPGISQMKAEDIMLGKVDMSNYTSLFVGMANHSQCLGPIVSSTAVVLLGDLLFSIKKADPLYILLLLCCPYLIYLTSSRTGMGAYVLGMIFVVYVFFKARGIGARWKSRVFSFLIFLSVLGMFVVMTLPGFQKRVGLFLLKSRSVDSRDLSTEAILSSRQALMDRAIYNFKKSPIIGNGFQVSEEMERLKIKGGASILSAPIEKGVWVTAVLEEGGAIGWTIFVVFLMACIVKSIKRRAYIGASSLFLCMLTNLGEFTFFSMSYSGGYTWAMVFVGLALDGRRLRDEDDAIMRRIEMMQRE